jgi:adenylate cyclase
MQGGNAGTSIEMRERVVLFADLVESVRLMQEHETLVIARWRQFAAEVRERAPARGGRVVRSAGDALLLTFDAAGPALLTALDLHERLGKDCFDGTPALRLRIGLHRTECLEDEHDAYGAGVNLAARLATLAAPGETILSVEVRSSVRDGVHADLEDMGPRYLKHLPAPVRAFRAWRCGRRPSLRHTALPDLRPLLAVVPFRPLDGDVEQSALGHAAAELLATALSRHPRLRLVARASTSALQYECLDAAQLGLLHERFNIGYLLSGSLRGSGNSRGLRLELCSLPDGRVLWNDDSPLPVASLFQPLSEWAAEVSARVGLAIAQHGKAVLRRLPMDSLPAYRLYLGACLLMNSLVECDFHRAREALEHLAERHPRQPGPLAMLALWHVTHGVQSWSGNQSSGYPVAQALALQSLDRDPEQTDALCALAVTAMNVEQDPAKACALNEAALRIDPSEATAWSQLSAAQALSGATAEAVDSAKRALQHSPLAPDLYLLEAYAAMAAMADGQLPLAVEWSGQSLKRQVLHAPSHRFHIAALWQSGQAQAAREALALFAQVCPEAHASGVWHMASAPPWRRRYEESLAQAGLRPSS